MFRKLIIINLFWLAGCLPEVPSVPTTASCTLDGFVIRPVMDDITNLETLQFVLDENGEAMTCELS